MQNKRLILKSRPAGEPVAGNWEILTGDVPAPGEGEVLIRVLYISIDPAMRGWMNEGKSYIRPVELGQTMRALGVGEVLSSGDERFKAGDFVAGTTGVQEYALLNAKDLQKINPERVPLPVYLGTLGMSGMTAYFGLLKTGQPQAGETVVVSGAAGAVGSVAGQIAKIKGCRVVGIAGGDDKCRYVTETLGFDACVDYRKGELRKQLKEACPDGVDVFFDNVGGEILDTVLTLINRKARIVICGAISQYNQTKPEGPRNYMSLLVNRARMEGIVVFDNAAEYPVAAREMTGWIAEGRLNTTSYIETGGVEAFHDTLMKLFSGANTGKMVLKMVP